METLRRNQSGIIFALIGVGLTVGCQNQNVGGTASSTSATTVIPTPVQTTSNGGVSCSTNNFCINVNEPVQTTQVLHMDGNYSQPCDISTGQDATCILESSELDLYWLGTALSYNVPAGLCPYFRFTPYFYYQFQPGVGPIGVTTSTDASGNVTLSSVTYPGGLAGVIAGGGQSATPPVGNPALSSISLDGGEIACSTNYSGATPAGPNCCTGNYSAVSVVAGAPTTTTPATWGGNSNNCLTGPAVDTQKLSANGYPESTLYKLAGSSLNESYTIAAPGNAPKGQYASNAYISNYWESGLTGSYPLVTSGGATGAPLAVVGPTLLLGSPPVNPGCISIGNGNVFCTGNPWYQFECLDQAEDLIGRVRVMVRSWTSQAQFNGFVAAGGVGGIAGIDLGGLWTFNLSGAEPAPYIDQPFEDRETWVIPQTAGAVVGSQGFNDNTPTQSFGFGNLYPGGSN